MTSDPHPPAFNLDRKIIALAAVLFVIHAYETLILTDTSARLDFVIRWAFIPALWQEVLRIGTAEEIAATFKTFVTYGFLHADWMHVGINSLWLVAFGQPVAMRLSAVRFSLLFLVCLFAGSLLHWLTNWNDVIPVVGASAGVAGFMGAACRFVFPASEYASAMPPSQRPVLSLREALSHPTVLTILLVFLVINILTGIDIVTVGVEAQLVAWQAHIGGFALGFLSFPFFVSPKRALY
jgi:membrane associated rhomboid family serine protease